MAPLRLFKKKRRARLRAQPFPGEWDAILRRNVSLYARLPGDDRRELQGHIQVFLAEKNFEGCGGLEMTDEIRLTIAAQACLLLLHRETDYYPEMVSIFVYPTVFVSGAAEEGEDGVVSEFGEDRSGESWDRGPIVLSWEDVLAGASPRSGGYNAVIHEFVHQLDLENGAVDGVPRLADRARYERWARVFEEAFESHRKNVSARRKTSVDAYGAQAPDEFFAVVTEHFFHTPLRLRKEYPEVYEELSLYFSQDPSAWRSD